MPLKQDRPAFALYKRVDDTLSATHGMEEELLGREALDERDGVHAKSVPVVVQEKSVPVMQEKSVPVMQKVIDPTLDQLIKESIHSHFQIAINATDEKMRTYLQRYATLDESVTKLVCKKYTDTSIGLVEKREKTKKFEVDVDSDTRTVITNVIKVYYDLKIKAEVYAMETAMNDLFTDLGEVVCKPIRALHMDKVKYLETIRDETVERYKCGSNV
jgi:hypothetical protein